MPQRNAAMLVGSIRRNSLNVRLAGAIGSLAKGKRADLIMVDTHRANLGMITDPYETVVGATQPANVDLVMIDGRILKRGGRLVALDEKRIVADAAEANLALRKRAQWW